MLDDLSSGTRDNLPAGVGLIEADVASLGVVASSRRPVLTWSSMRQRRSACRHLCSTPLAIAMSTWSGRRTSSRVRKQPAPRASYSSPVAAPLARRQGPARRQSRRHGTPTAYTSSPQRRMCASGTMPHAIVRYSNVYGPRQRSGLEGGVVATFLGACRSHGRVTIFGDGRQARDFLYVDDAVSAAIAIAAADTVGTWNVATGQSTTVLDLLAAVEAIAGRACEITFEPSRAGDIVTSGLQVNLIREELGWEPRMSLQRGLEAMLNATSGRLLSLKPEREEESDRALAMLRVGVPNGGSPDSGSDQHQAKPDLTAISAWRERGRWSPYCAADTARDARTFMHPP